jgi:anti-sigma regulatory factor (Ser/Thr protein kinase)
MARCERRFPARPEHVSAARRDVLELARGTGLPAATLDAVRLAVSEAVSNAVVHGYRGDDEGDVTVIAETRDSQLKVLVCDEGCGMSPHFGAAGAGLGLPLIAGLTDTMSIGPAGGGRGTVLCMTFRLPIAVAG